MDDDPTDRTASLMTPAKLAQVGAARPPASSSAFLNKMAADVGHPHVRRLAELRVDFQAQAAAAQEASIQPALERFAQTLPRLDFKLLQPRGWWAGVTGKGRDAGTDFAARFEQVEESAKEMAKELAAVQKQMQPHMAGSDRMLLEFEVEYRALDKIIDQGARWLQDMRNQLKTRQAQPAIEAEDQRAIDEDSARCEILVSRLKALRASISASQQAHQQVRATADRRSALMRSLDQLVSVQVKDWRERVSTLVTAAWDGKSAVSNLESAEEAHFELSQQLLQLIDDCGQLRASEETLVQNLAAMGEQLEAAS